MPVFTAIVKLPSGENKHLERQAESKTSLLALLRSEGFIPVRVQATREKSSLGFSLSFRQHARKKPSRKDIHALMGNLATLLRSGMDIERSLRILEKEAREPLRTILQAVADNVRRGERLSEAMSRADAFTTFQIRVIRAGEYGGNLHLAFARIARVMERQAEIRAKIRNATAYPLFLVFFGLLSFMVMVIFVLPKFLRIYEEMHVKLPLITIIVLQVSYLFRVFGVWLIPLLGFGAVAGAKHLLKFRVNLSADRFRMSFPLFGAIIQGMETVTFLQTLGLLLQSGIPIARALNVSSEVGNSALFANSALEMEKGVEMGEKLSSEMRKQNLFPETAVNLVAVGEETGRLQELLIETSETMEKRIDERIKTLLAILEPLLILLVGVIIGAIVISMLLPIFSLSSGLRRQ